MRVWRLSADKRRLEVAGVLGEPAISHTPSSSSSAPADSNSNSNSNNNKHGDDDDAEGDQAKKSKGKGKGKSKSKTKVNGHVPNGAAQSHAADKRIRGIINDIAVFERGERGADGLSVICAVGKEHRLGRWHRGAGAGAGARNGGVVFEIPRLSHADTNGVAGTDDSPSP